REEVLVRERPGLLAELALELLDGLLARDERHGLDAGRGFEPEPERVGGALIGALGDEHLHLAEPLLEPVRDLVPLPRQQREERDQYERDGERARRREGGELGAAEAGEAFADGVGEGHGGSGGWDGLAEDSAIRAGIQPAAGIGPAA